MPVSTELRTPRLLLNHLRETDIPVIVPLADNPNISDVTLNIPSPYGEENARDWLQMGTRGRKKGDLFLFAIRDPETEAFLGGIGLNVNARHRRGEFGYWLGEPFWGQGYMTEALTAILDFGFGELDLWSIQANHLVENPASGRVMAKSGMKRQFLQEDMYVKDGVLRSVWLYRVLRPQWEV